MAITLSGAVFDAAESTTGWTLVGSADGLATGQSGSGQFSNAIPAKQGSGSVEFHLTGSGQSGGLQSPAVTGFAGTAREVGCWFLNPGEEDGGAKLLRDANSNALQLGIVHSGGTTYVDQAFIRAANNNIWPAGWMKLRATGNFTGITAVVPYVNNCNAPNNAKQDLEYQVDYAHSYDYIQISGTESLSDVYQTSLTNDWGVVEKFDNFYVFNCGIEFLSGCNFSAENEFIFLNHFGNVFKQNVIIRSGATVRFGSKSTPSTISYANNGCQLLSPETALDGSSKPGPTLLVEDGATFSAYDTLFQGFGLIQLGETANTADVELIKCDFYDNDDVEFRSTLLEADDLRIHQDSTDKGNLGQVFQTPAKFERIKVFNSINALQFDVNTTVNGYDASNNTYDAVVKEGVTLQLTNSSYDTAKLLRVV